MQSITLPGKMIEHQWAAARLWEGLSTASANRWHLGALALLKTSWPIVAEEPSLSRAPAGDDPSRVRLLAERARGATTTAERSEVFGELLATCARCHVTIRDRASSN